MVHKSRTQLLYKGQGEGTITDASGNVIARSGINSTFVQRGMVDTEGHLWPPRRGRLYDMDLGGSFSSSQTTGSAGASYINVASSPPGTPGIRYAYSGDFFAYYDNTPGIMNAYIPSSNQNVLNAAGATGIARTLPTRALSGGGQFLGELRELPSIPVIRDWRRTANGFRQIQRRRNLPRDVASEVLNLEFGWVPFIRDLRDFATQYRNLTQTTNQFLRNANRPIRRRVDLGTETSTVVADLGFGYGAPILATYVYRSPGRVTRTTVTSTHRWFSGCFVYHVPLGDSPLERLQRAEQFAHRIFGLRVDAELVWQLAPWSWAVGWVSNANDVARNVAAFANDGLVLKYGYLMEETSVTETYTLAGIEFEYPRGKRDFSQSFSTTTRTRIRATPYGFGLNPVTFTPRQWAIIGALGISRAPRSLDF